MTMRLETDAFSVDEKAARRYCREMIEKAENRLYNYSISYIASAASGLRYLAQEASSRMDEIRQSLAKLHLSYALITSPTKRNKNVIVSHMIKAATLDTEMAVDANYMTPIYFAMIYADYDEFMFDSSAVRIPLSEKESQRINEVLADIRKRIAGRTKKSKTKTCAR